MQITDEMIDAAARLAGLSFTQPERALMREALQRQLSGYQQLRAIPIPNAVAPALAFSPHAGDPPTAGPSVAAPAGPAVRPPADLEDLAFAPVALLSQLIRGRQISSLALTEM